MKSLNDLVAQAESIATNLEDDEIPHIQRSIDQLSKRGGQFSYNRGAQNDIKAAKLLGNKVGYELSAGLSKTIESLQILSAYDGGSEIKIVDIPGFLKNERETAILSSINITRNMTANESYRKTEEAKLKWWCEEKRKILGLLSNGDKLPNMMDTCGSRGLSRSIGMTETQVSGKLNRDETSYARQVNLFVSSALCEASMRQPESLCSLLIGQEASPMKSSKCPEICELARLLTRYCLLPPCTPDQRQSEGNISRQMVKVAIDHLATEFLSYMHQCVESLSCVSQLTTRTVLVTFLDTQMLPHLGGAEGMSFEDGCIDRVPVWPLIYICLRAGLFEEAILVAKEAASNIGEWHLWLREYVSEGRVSSEHARKIITDYKRNVRGTNDSSKRLVYCIVGGCDTEDNHQQVLLSVDDFMWARLSHLRRSYCSQDGLLQSLNRTRNSTEQMSLAHLQRLVSEEYGESHFQAQQQPVTFCKILLLCQLIEPALAFLARFEQMRCHAVHAAVVLWHQGLLLVSDNLAAPLLSRHDQDPQGLSRLNMARLVTLYTRQLEVAHPKEALDLFYLLSDVPSGTDDGVTFVTLASKLAIDCGRLDLVLGLVSRYGSVCDAVLDSVTARLVDCGRLEDAHDALLLAGRWDGAAGVLGDLLAGCLSLPGDHRDTERLMAKADHLRHAMPPSRSADTLGRLTDVASFVSLADQGSIDAALLALDRTQLLPASTDAGRILASLDAFRGLPELVRSLVPAILVSAMRLLRHAAADRRYSPDSMADVRRRASALITFTGQLPYRMPADVYASLSQLELDIN